MTAPQGARRRGWSLVRTTGVLAALIGLGALACNDSDDDFVNIVEPVISDIVATFKDSTFDYATLHTFAMPDTVVHFAPATGTPAAVSRQFDRQILDQVRADFKARGYVEVTDPRSNTPNFVVLVGATATTNYNAWVGYSWYGLWGFYPGWGWYAPGFGTDWGIIYPWYRTVGVTAYTRGTLVVDLIPTVSVNPLAKTINSAWAGVATGLLDGTESSARISAAIDEMFRQSPYLTAAPPVPTPF
jgi:hypothetical protein